MNFIIGNGFYYIGCLISWENGVVYILENGVVYILENGVVYIFGQIPQMTHFLVYSRSNFWYTRDQTFENTLFNVR